MPEGAPAAEVRLDRMRPAEVTAAISRAPVAWLPLGAVEYHAPHLPFGTDSLTAAEVVIRAARAVGGVVLPPGVTTLGTLHLPWSLRFEPTVVEATLRATIDQLAEAGTRVVVVHTGHAPLDLLHLIKRVCAEAEASRRVTDDTFRAYGLCYLELNVALGAGLGTSWPVPVDHGSVLETSLVLAIAPELVDLDALPQPADAPIVGIYGPDPRGGASAEMGELRLTHGASLLAERVRTLLAGGHLDAFDDLRLLVERYWSEPLELRVDDGGMVLRNPGPMSRYVSSVRLTVDGETLHGDEVWLRNSNEGEAGTEVVATSLGPESGFYVRRTQDARLLTRPPLASGERSLVVELGLAGVATTVVRARVALP